MAHATVRRKRTTLKNIGPTAATMAKLRQNDVEADAAVEDGPDEVDVMGRGGNGTKGRTAAWKAPLLEF